MVPAVRIVVETPINRRITQINVESHLRYPEQRKSARSPENL